MQMLAGLLNAASTAYHVPRDQSHFACNDVAFGLRQIAPTLLDIRRDVQAIRDSMRKVRSGGAKLGGQR